MKKIYRFFLLPLIFTGAFALDGFSQNAWINEIHYDNAGTDVNEMIEVVIENAGSYTLSDFVVTLYNGNGGGAYGTHLLSTFTAGSVYGNFSFYYKILPVNGLQNGGTAGAEADGLALSYLGAVIPGQFLSYEGVPITATGGVALGLISTDIIVEEDNPVPAVGLSLQLGGTGNQYSNFTWQAPLAATAGLININQTIALPSTLTGYVYDFDGNPLAGAKVEKVGGVSTFSNGAGLYTLTPLSSGSQQFKCSKPGYNAYLATINIPSNTTVNQDFTLTNPEMALEPGSLFAILGAEESTTANLTITNEGNGQLDWNATVIGQTFTDLTISLYDSYGDGWNGGKLDVLVNGNIVLNDITFTSGGGPVNFTFSVPDNGEITTMFTAGGFQYECNYTIFDPAMNQLWHSEGVNPLGPPDIMPGQLVWQPIDWLTLDLMTGNAAPSGGTQNVAVTIDAAQTPPVMAPGVTYSADIVFSSPSGIPSVTIPVTLVVSDGGLQGPQELTTYIVDEGNGQFMLKWKYFTLRDMQFSHFTIVRNGEIVGTTPVSSYKFNLAEPGTYCFKVYAVYQGGVFSDASNEVCITYPLAPGVPVAGWALGIGVMLILGYAVYMFRKRI